MPLTTSAKKALRQSKRKQTINYRIRFKLKKAIDAVKKGSNEAVDLTKVYSTLDRAAKSGIIHKNKASRLKSRLTKLVKSRSASTTTDKQAVAKKEPAKKTAVKSTPAKKTTPKKAATKNAAKTAKK